MNRNRIAKLAKLLAAIECAADPDELTQAAILLEPMRKKLSVRCQSLGEQNNALFLASAAGDKATLRNYAEFSQYQDIRCFAAEAANARRTTPR